MAEHNQGEPKTVEEQEELIKSQADSDCIFCKIIKGSIPCFKIFENSTTLAFFDINPISSGHALVIPKCLSIAFTSQRLHESMKSFSSEVSDSVTPINHVHATSKLPPHFLSEKIVINEFSAIQDILPTAKKIAIELGLTDYNILQNNGRIAHQEVDHVHFHIIPKPSATDSEGLVIGWPSKKADMETLGQKAKALQAKLDNQSTSNTSYL
ncbi:hypothetical protein PSHT_05196 [Puccinia striiformis]|uniref:HIT domain-containing protein n=1 Tax=Puccinia striiformis TaxID=27350 RepID=A0A2S4WB03_9BASI|nr:hypothetical protein PSHT_05196 [Puccinia striiformis]